MGWAKRIGLGCGGLVALAVVGVGGAAAVVASTAEGAMQFPDAPYPELVASADPAVIAAGEYLFRGPAHCIQCHAGPNPDRAHPEEAARDDIAPAGGLIFEMGPIATTWGANLTPDSETGIGTRTDAELARAIRTGVLHDGMLSIFMRFSVAKLSDEDLVAVISFMRAQPPVHNPVPKAELGWLGRLVVPTMMPLNVGPLEGPRHVPPSEEPSLERGEYLANSVGVCLSCHSEVDMSTFQPVPPLGGGSQPEASHGEDADMEFVAPNLTSSRHGITGKLDEDGFLARLRAGRVHVSSIMPWEGVSRMTESDMRSLYRYLRSLPPVDIDRGPSYRQAGWTPPSPAPAP